MLVREKGARGGGGDGNGNGPGLSAFQKPFYAEIGISKTDDRQST